MNFNEIFRENVTCGGVVVLKVTKNKALLFSNSIFCEIYSWSLGVCFN